MKISCPVILKNEADTVYKTLESIYPIVDEFVISIDSTTTDNTEKEVARFFEDNIDTPYSLIFHKWENDFSKTRNDVIDKCSGDYIFIIDGHEYIENIEKLKNLKNRDDVDIYILDVHLHKEIGDAIISQPRLFKNKYKYINASHNKLDFDQYKENILKITEVVIHHTRPRSLTEERAGQRKNMNIQSLLDSEKSGDNTAKYKLGCEYMSFNEFDKAIKWFEDYLKTAEYAGEKYQMMIYLAMCYYHNLDFNNAERILRECEQCNIENRNDHMVFLAELYYTMGNYFNALFYAFGASNVLRPTQFYTLYPTFYYEEPFKIIAKCFTRIGYSQGIKQANLVLERMKNDNNS
jgi:glycosyltransferase involved in cell wall biosynthesis